jgi:hypothetical protein
MGPAFCSPGVSTQPGWAQLTVTPSGPSSRPQRCVSITRARWCCEYAIWGGGGGTDVKG